MTRPCRRTKSARPPLPIEDVPSSARTSARVVAGARLPALRTAEPSALDGVDHDPHLLLLGIEGHVRDLPGMPDAEDCRVEFMVSHRRRVPPPQPSSAPAKWGRATLGLGSHTALRQPSGPAGYPHESRKRQINTLKAQLPEAPTTLRVGQKQTLQRLSCSTTRWTRQVLSGSRSQPACTKRGSNARLPAGN